MIRSLTLATAATATVLAVSTAQASAPTWEDRGPVATATWWTVSYGGGKFVAVTDWPAMSMTSADGATWATSSAISSYEWWRSAYGGGKFVALPGRSGHPAAHSSDGLNWDTAVLPAKFNSIAYGADRFVAVGEASGKPVAVSSDGGATWSTANTLASLDGGWEDVTYGGGRFVAVARYGATNSVMTSPDGLNWAVTRNVSTGDSAWYGVAHGIVGGQDRYVAVGQCNAPCNHVMWSSNGSTWYQVSTSAATGSEWQDVAYGEINGQGLFVAVAAWAGSGSHRIMTSPDGENWTAVPNVATSSLRQIAYGNGVFVAVGGSGTQEVITLGTPPPPTTTPTTVALPPPVFIPAPTTTTTTTPSTTTTTTTGPRPPQTITVSPNGTGQLPDVTPGRVTVTENGNEISTTFRRTGDAAWQLQGSNFDWKVDVPSLRRSTSSTEGFVTLLLGGRVEASGQGFEPGSMVDVWLFSDPVYIGSLPVADDGTFDGELTVPTNIAPGTHTLQANGLTTDGNLRSMNIGVEVATPRLQLPVTGNSGQPITGWAVALLAFGLVILSYRRLHR